MIGVDRASCVATTSCARGHAASSTTTAGASSPCSRPGRLGMSRNHRAARVLVCDHRLVVRGLPPARRAKRKTKHREETACRLSPFDPPPFDSNKLKVEFLNGAGTRGPPPNVASRRYTLTHNDWNGELFLAIGSEYNIPQISGWYTRLLRDEVLAEWRDGCLQIYCHVGGIKQWWLAPGQQIRNLIFMRELLLVLDTIRYADRKYLQQHSELAEAPTLVHFHATQSELNRTECWGPVECATCCRAVKSRPQSATSPPSTSSFTPPCFSSDFPSSPECKVVCSCAMYSGIDCQIKTADGKKQDNNMEAEIRSSPAQAPFTAKILSENEVCSESLEISQHVRAAELLAQVAMLEDALPYQDEVLDSDPAIPSPGSSDKDGVPSQRIVSSNGSMPPSWSFSEQPDKVPGSCCDKTPTSCTSCRARLGITPPQNHTRIEKGKPTVSRA